MGSHHSHEKDGGSGASTPRAGSRRGAGATPRGSASGSELDAGLAPAAAPAPASMVPVEKLAKLLAQRSQKEDGVTGVTENCFTKYLFPRYPELARRFFASAHRAARARDRHIPVGAFRAHCERVLAIIDDADIIDTYVRMFGSESEEGVVLAEGFRSLLHTSYRLSMDHYPEGPQTCQAINTTLSAVVRGCFNNKESHSVGFVVRWLDEHCHRLILPMHRYVVHMLATRHRDMESSISSAGSGAGLELATPVLERSPWADGGGCGVDAGPDGCGEGESGGRGAASALLPISAAWLLAGAAPPLYSRPVKPPPPVLHQGGGLASALWLARLVCAVPSHWVPLYASREHGLGANRFLHHTLAYRGPSLVVLSAPPLVLVVASACEWRESHQYWGSGDSALFQLAPGFALVQRAPKMLYLNTAIRGYPRGLRAGADPRQPLLTVGEGFDSITFQGAPHALADIEVWGCGEAAARDVQLDIKKWQVREAERHRDVKLSAAEWLEHPDRYLLELAGRTQYNNTGS